MKKIPVVILLMFFLNSCEEDYNEYFSPVQKIIYDKTASVNEKKVIKVIHTGSSGCSAYSRHNLSVNDSIYVFEFFQRPKDKVCTDNLITLETEIEISFDKTGQKVLMFRQWHGYLTDTVNVVH
jgi:hypothetical protein